MNLASARIHTCSQWTLQQVKNDVYWWGVIPYDHRARAIEKIRKNPNGNKREKIQVGSMVVYKKQPYFRAGTKALKLLDNEPRIGELNQDIFKMDETKAEFKICKTSDLQEKEYNLEVGTENDSKKRKRTYEEMKSGAVEIEKWNIKRCIFFPKAEDEMIGNSMAINCQF